MLESSLKTARHDGLFSGFRVESSCPSGATSRLWSSSWKLLQFVQQFSVWALKPRVRAFGRALSALKPANRPPQAACLRA